MGINSLLPWKNSNVETDKKAYVEFRRRMSVLSDAKVLVVGGGGREHAIVDALSKSSHVGKIYCAPGNAGIASQAECVPIKDTQIDELLKFVKDKGIDLTVVGPEASLSKGIVDVFTQAGEPIFGPSKAAAMIESSKDFAKRLMQKYGVPTAAYRTFSDYSEALEYVRNGSFPVVLKYDGLAAGKGVVIPETLEQAEATLKDMLLDDKFGKGKVVIEEYMTGPEFSFLCFVCGEEVFPMVLSQDHKRAFDGDKGPNTGGMGAYSPVPFITEEDYEYALEKIMKPVAAGMVAEGCPFKGVLYGGLMKTPSGIKVVEFNCRFGDPETEVVLPRLETDIFEVFCAIAEGEIPSFKVYEDDLVLAYLDINPFSEGHTLVIPKEHFTGLLDTPSDVLKEIVVRVQKVAAHLKEALPCDGFNILQNNGAAAGQTVPHVHFHIVPRYGAGGGEIAFANHEGKMDALAALAERIRM